ncbi:pleckstrin homology-like domain family A member 1 [Trichomycterus rosablanca]|uniref:pleckstrin homology-like domain family A member 1 n=1 Tax=Trichomycterus rosablanca TaxID=2290929 RepID=UPI002F3569E2
MHPPASRTMQPQHQHQQQHQQQQQREEPRQDQAAGEGVRVLKQGGMEKRSNGILQLWARRHCALTEDALLVHKHARPGTRRPTELHFSRVRTVDCVERKGKHAYFTVVMADGREIDFRCGADECWSAEITLQMVQYKNRQAVLAVRSTRHKQQLLSAHRAKPAALQPGTTTATLVPSSCTEREQHQHQHQHSG